MIQLVNNLITGYAFDMHITNSVYIGDDPWGHAQFENTYSSMGCLLKRLKYKHEISALSEILDLLCENQQFCQFMETVDAILPVPPSNKMRNLQPVMVLAQKISELFKKDLVLNALQTTNTEQIKNFDTNEKYTRVKNSLIIDESQLSKNMRILIFDDIFSSGSTISAYISALYERGYPHVQFFTLTKTKKSR